MIQSPCEDNYEWHLTNGEFLVLSDLLLLPCVVRHNPDVTGKSGKYILSYNLQSICFNSYLVTFDNILQFISQLQFYIWNEVDGWSAQTIVLAERIGS